MKRTLIILLAVLLALTTAGCGSSGKSENISSPAAESVPAGGIHHAEITVKDYGTITVELNGDVAPITVDNFMNLAKSGFYNGLTFHRIIDGFMIQGGDPTGTGSGGSKDRIKGEFSSNGVNNPISHKRGVISMARAMDPDSAGSQFFIMHADGEFLDGQYAAFGHVVNGMDVVDRIASAKTNRWAGDRPYEDQVMETVRVVEE